jgi:hypothetical protein
MKSLKPIMLVVSGMLLAFVFAFKVNSNAPIKERAVMYLVKSDLLLVLPDGSEKKFPAGIFTVPKDANKTLNELAKDGWELKAVDAYSYYLERDKQ